MDFHYGLIYCTGPNRGEHDGLVQLQLELRDDELLLMIVTSIEFLFSVSERLNDAQLRVGIEELMMTFLQGRLEANQATRLTQLAVTEFTSRSIVDVRLFRRSLCRTRLDRIPEHEEVINQRL